MKTQLKRQNFNITPEQEADINWLKEALDAPSAKDAILLAVRTLMILSRETKRGRRIYLTDENGEKERLLIQPLFLTVLVGEVNPAPPLRLPREDHESADRQQYGILRTGSIQRLLQPIDVGFLLWRNVEVLSLELCF